MNRMFDRLYVTICCVISVSVCLSGCGIFTDLDAVELVEEDATTDAADVADTTPPDDTSDTPAEDATDGSSFGNCNPVVGTCEGSDFCTLRLDTSVSPPELITVCKAGSEAGDLNAGESCNSGECSPGLFCVNWARPDPRGEVCSSFCELSSGNGCGDQEFCTNPFDALSELGFCAPSCDPFNPDCPTGTQCHPDPGLLDSYDARITQTPSFQCMAIASGEDFSGKTEGTSCDLGNVNLDGCASGLVCYPDGTNVNVGTCVKPCTDDTVCGGSTCGPETGPWSLKFCE